MENTAKRYLDTVAGLCRTVGEAQEGNVEKAAKMCAEALKRGGYLFTFGTGHSHLLALEIFYRAGGLARVWPILDESLMLHKGAAESSQIERTSGLGRRLLDNTGADSRSVLILISNSGCNTVAVEMAEAAKEKGIRTVALTSLAHSARMTSRHPQGHKLKDVCDVVLDNGGCFGDAAVDLGTVRTGPTSTVLGAMLLQAVVSRTVELCLKNGTDPEVFTSANTPEGDRINETLINRYRGLIPGL